MDEPEPGAAADTGSIEERLHSRLRDKESSAKLSAEAGGQEGMFRAAPTDLAEPHASVEYMVTDSKEHLETFQSVFRKLRSRGRDSEGHRDASDSMLKVMRYVQRKKSAAGGGAGGS